MTSVTLRIVNGKFFLNHNYYSQGLLVEKFQILPVRLNRKGLRVELSYRLFYWMQRFQRCYHNLLIGATALQNTEGPSSWGLRCVYETLRAENVKTSQRSHPQLWRLTRLPTGCGPIWVDCTGPRRVSSWSVREDWKMSFELFKHHFFGKVWPSFHMKNPRRPFLPSCCIVLKKYLKPKYYWGWESSDIL